MIKKLGFSLVELSIAVVIISLILSLILTTDKLNKAAKTRGVISEVNSFQKATSDFHEKYGFLPGDFPFTGKFFNLICDATASNCDGNGNDFVNYMGSNNNLSKNSADYTEPLLFWRHLYLAGMVSGKYRGKTFNSLSGYSCSNHMNCCINDDTNRSCPKSVYNDGSYVFASWPYGTGVNDSCGSYDKYFPKNVNIFMLGKYRADDEPRNGLITPKDAYSIDEKIDDGVPTRGIVQARSGYDYLTNVSSRIGPCVVDASGNNQSNNNAYGKNYEYNVSLESDACLMGFLYLEHSPCNLP